MYQSHDQTTESLETEYQEKQKYNGNTNSCFNCMEDVDMYMISYI